MQAKAVSNTKIMKKLYQLNMPKKLGLPAKSKPYIFQETENGYFLQINEAAWIGMPKFLIETNPHLYTLINN